MPFRLLLTGRVELKDGEGRIVTLRTRKVTLLLAIFAMAPEETGQDGWRRREELAELVWEEAEPDAARLSLRNALHALRRTLGPDAVRSQGDCVALAPSVLALEEGEGDFMPGYEEEWVIDQRLRQRVFALAKALDAARAANDPAEALREATKACAIDPLDPEAARLRGELLVRLGRRTEAAGVNAAHRARVVRELGVFVPAPLQTVAENPLLRTFEWTFERDPNEACALLAATTKQWFWCDVETALDAHQRVLAASPRRSRERQMVEAATSFLEVASGRFGGLEVAAERHQEALATGESAVANLLCHPLAEGFAARGDLRRAVAYGEEALRMARARAATTSSKAALALAENALGMHERQIGNLEEAARRIDAATALIEEDGTALHVWSIRWNQAADWIERGRFDRAADRLEACHRVAAAYGGDRFVPWLVGSEARLLERMGDLRAACEAYARMRAMAPAAGATVVHLADEGLMRVHCGLREYGEAAQAWARVVRSRQRTGTVLSPHAQELATPTLRILRERLAPDELRIALRRAA